MLSCPGRARGLRYVRREVRGELGLRTEAACGWQPEPAASCPARGCGRSEEPSGAVPTTAEAVPPSSFSHEHPSQSRGSCRLRESLRSTVARRRSFNKVGSVRPRKGVRPKCDDTARLKERASRLFPWHLYCSLRHCSAFPYSLSRTNRPAERALPDTPFQPTSGLSSRVLTWVLLRPCPRSSRGRLFSRGGEGREVCRAGPQQSHPDPQGPFLRRSPHCLPSSLQAPQASRGLRPDSLLGST